jgi:anionic cell wall polymer biosynthesis LytR-Cps2A-Psr (LCP) family protein
MADANRPARLAGVALALLCVISLAWPAPGRARSAPLWEEFATPTPASTPALAPGPAPLARLPDGTFNVALLGIDYRPQFKLRNTDVIVIASINADAPAVTLLAIPRDTQAFVPGHGYTKINQAYALGGIDLFKQTIRHNFGLEIHNYAMVNFAAVVNTVDALGGISVVATCPLYHVFPKDPYYFGDPYFVSRDHTDTFTGEVWKAGTRVPTLTIDIPKAGIYTLNGLQALAFARARYGVPGGDLDRGRREQRIIRGIFAKAKQPDSLAKLPALFSAFHQDFETDFTLPDLLKLVPLASRIDDAVIRSRFLDDLSASGAVLPDGTLAPGPPGGYAAQVEQALSVALNQRRNDGVPVEVWNGTRDPLFGLVVADRLAEMGLRVTSVKPADGHYTQTRIVDYTTSRKGSIVPLLQRAFNIAQANVIAQPSKTGPRYRIIAGDDFNPCYYQ